MTRPSLRRLAAVAVAFVLAGSALSLLLSSATPISVLMASTTIVVAALPIVHRLRTRTFDILEPIVSGSVVLALIFGVRPIAMLLDGNLVYRSFDTRAEFPFVIALGLIGTAAFVGAYERVRLVQSQKQHADQPAAKGLQRTVLDGYIAILAVASFVLFAVHLSRLGDGLADGLRLLLGGASPELIARWAGTTEYLSASPILASCAATLLGVSRAWRLRPYQLLLVVILIAYPLVVFYVSGDRRYMIPTIGVPLVAWMLMTGHRPDRRFLVIGVPLSFLVLTAIPFVRWGAAQADTGGFSAAFVEGIGNPVRAVERFILGPDTGMFSAMAVEVRVLRSPGDFYYGRATVGDLVLAPIPHLIFPGKPQTARDDLLVRAYGSPCDLTAGGVCDDFSIIGTSYQDLWVPGVAGLLALIGAASAALWSGQSRWRRDPRYVVVLAAWVVFVPIIFRAGAMPATAWCLYFVVPCLFGAVISIRRLDPTTGDLSKEAAPSADTEVHPGLP